MKQKPLIIGLNMMPETISNFNRLLILNLTRYFISIIDPILINIYSFYVG
jgi:hypothetical protein